MCHRQIIIENICNFRFYGSQLRTYKKLKRVITNLIFITKFRIRYNGLKLKISRNRYNDFSEFRITNLIENNTS